jgi:DNA repair exonuclease SbcCD ATPase subunit
VSTFLSHIELRDFRTFGLFRLDIAPGPGLTLIVGPNGLGKSTFFDSIEWGLTGQIRRLADYVGRRREADYLTRRDAERPDSHAVALAFDTGAAFTRTATSAPSDADLLATLKTDGWGDIRDLGAYLTLTHFLGQAAQQRFTSRSKNDQWEALKGPSGIDRLEQVRTALRGPATSAAFRRRLAQETAELELAEQTLARWRDDAGRLTSLRAAAQAAGTTTAEAMSRDLDALDAACSAADVQTASSSFSDERTARLIAARVALDGARARAKDDQRGLARLRAIWERYENLAAPSDPDGTAAAAARRAVGEATAESTAASLASRTVERAIEVAAATAASAEAALERSTAVAAKVGDLADLAASIDQLALRRHALTAEVASADASRVAADEALAVGRRRQISRQSLQERRDQDQRVVERARRLAGLAVDASNAEERAIRGAAAAKAAEVSADSLRTEGDRLRTELTTAEAGLATARRRASEIAEALATVAKHVSEHDERCPVCTTAFPPGQLRALAEAAASGQDADLANRAQRVEELKRSLDAANATLAAALESGADSANARLLADAAAQALATGRAEVARLLGTGLEEDLASTAAARLAKTKAELATVETEIALLDLPIAELEAAATRAARAHASSGAERVRVEADSAAAERRTSELTFDLDGDGDAADPGTLAARVEADRIALREANDRLTEFRVELASALATETTARQRVDAAVAARAQTDRAIADASVARRDLARDWAAAGADGEPSERGVASAADRVSARLAALDALLAHADHLARGLESLATATELATLEAHLVDAGGAAAATDPSAHERALIDRLDQARAALRATTDTQKAVNAYTVELKKKADRFSAEFLKPLNGLIDDFNRTLLSTPGETVQFSADAAVNRTDLGMQLRYADEVDNSRYDTRLAPQLVLSEGQLAANGFSILCAASVAYRWSNWRALLLDDPLQHNDIIHAAAFADVMRNLVEFDGYQLLMSSHDRAEGEFLFRKFDAAGLPCTMVTFTGPSREGVLSAPPRNNAAAARLLARPVAAAS